MKYGARDSHIHASLGDCSQRASHRQPFPCFVWILTLRFDRDGLGLIVEVDQGDSPGQKATVGQNGAAINFSGLPATAPKRPVYSLILIGLEVVSIALLIYFVFTGKAHGG